MTTTRLRQQMLSLLEPILIQIFMYKTTTCLMRPAITFFVPHMKKKTCLKQPLRNCICRRFSDYIYSIALL